ncbi:Tnr [Symbiodinium sp. CCMP2456]|nr:Tnr [Symbiodinium sp. CCMP2456]
MAERSVGLSMFARAPLIDWVQWEQQFGVLIETKSASQTRPFEERQWVLRQVNKFGRDEKEAGNMWKMKLAGPWKRDYDGYKGQIRLWLPAVEYEEKSQSQFMKGMSKEQSKGKKAPKEFELEAFRAHSLEAGFDHGHSFFGGARVSTDEDEQENTEPVSNSAPSTNVPQISPTKRKAEAATLDASEDETENAAEKTSKKPRKAANVSTARAAFFQQVSRAFQMKIASVQTRITEATKALKDEKDGLQPTTPTDTTTRQLYKDALLAAKEVVDAWLDKDVLTAAVQAHNESELVKDKPELAVDTTAPESLSSQSKAWAWLLAKSVSAVQLQHSDFLRSKSFMQEFVDAIPQCSLDENALDKKRVVWRRMFSCLERLESSLKKCSTDLGKHCKALAAASERETKRQKDREAKEAAAQHLSTQQAKIVKAKADGTDLPSIFKLQKEKVEEIKIIKANCMPSDIDLSKPAVIEESSHVAAWNNHAVCLQVMTNFGSRYKKVPLAEEQGKVNQPFQAKAGKEATEVMFAELVKPINKSIIDLSEVAQSWNNTSWMFGLLPKRVFLGCMPNQAACLRIMVYGELETYMFGISSFLAALKTMGLAVPSTAAELEKALEELTTEQWDSMSKHVKPMYHVLKKDQVLYVPTGFVVAERSAATTMNYGARKSFFFSEASAVVDYTMCCEMNQKEGKNTEKSQEVLSRLKAAVADLKKS